MTGKYTLIKALKIRGRSAIGPRELAYVIAEVGTNHNRDLNTAKSMLRGIAEAGCDCAKFQIYESNEIVSERVRASDYGLDILYGDISARQMFESHLKTPKEWFPELHNLCHDLGMDVAATIHGPQGLAWAQETGMDLIKIASMDHTNLPFLSSLVNAVDAPILVSLGMARLKDIDAVAAILKSHTRGFGLFHCCSVYPPERDELRLTNIPFLINRYMVPIGFSDHTTGIETSLQARAFGAIMFEKHVTLDRTQSGPDHSFAMEMGPLKEYVTELKRAPLGYPDTVGQFLEPFGKELYNRSLCVKSIISTQALPRGHVITADDIYLSRPGTGIAPAHWQEVVGRTLARPVEAQMPLHWHDLQDI